jgi:hypothetical protein
MSTLLQKLYDKYRRRRARPFSWYAPRRDAVEEELQIVKEKLRKGEPTRMKIWEVDARGLGCGSVSYVAASTEAAARKKWRWVSLEGNSACGFRIWNISECTQRFENRKAA